jgi:hypothetical protein
MENLKMKPKFIFIVAVLALIMPIFAAACPLKIINDNKLNIIIVDYHNNRAAFVKSDASAMIDPTIYGWQRHFKKEKFDVFYQVKIKSSQYLRRYEVTENYCTDNPDENKIKVSQFTPFMATNDKRFTVKELQPQAMKSNHHHEDHQHHRH